MTKRDTAIKGLDDLLYERVDSKPRYHNNSREDGQRLPKTMYPWCSQQAPWTTASVVKENHV